MIAYFVVSEVYLTAKILHYNNCVTFPKFKLANVFF